MSRPSVDVAIVGGGIAGLAAAWEVHRSGRSFLLLEAGERFGGKIRSETVDGFLLEAGPDSFLVRKPDVLELIAEIGLEDRLIACREIEPRLFLVQRGRLRELPPGLVTLAPRSARRFLASNVLSVPGRLRFLAEPWIRPRRENGDESLAAFARRRFGREALERLVEPILAHLHVGDAERMSLEACYPALAAMERRFGCVARGFRSARARTASTGAPPLFASLRGGVGELVDGLLERLPARRLLSAAPAVDVRPVGGGVETVLADGGTVSSRAAVVALPAAASAAVLDGLDPAVEHLRRLRTRPVASLSYGFDRRGVGHPLGGFGFFVPRTEGLRLLACTWSSSKFEERAATERVLIRAFVGGESAPLDGDPADGDRELAAAVLGELRGLLGLVGDPLVVRVHRTPDYPQYDVGHRRRLEELESRLPPAVRLAGSAFHGVGLPDVVRSGRRAARELVERLG